MDSAKAQMQGAALKEGITRWQMQQQQQVKEGWQEGIEGEKERRARDR